MRSSRPNLCLAAGYLRRQTPNSIQSTTRSLQQPLTTYNFSTIPTLHQRYGLPQFAPSSTPDLASHLALIRSQILIPGYINESQRKLIRKKKYATQLANDPVYASIGEEEVRLKHVDVLKDIPNQAWAFRRALDLLAEAEGQKQEELRGVEEEHSEEVAVDHDIEVEARPGTEKVTGFGDAVEVPTIQEQEEKITQHAMRKSNGTDWLNMLGIVEGYHQSKISRLPPALQALFIQRAMAAGQPGIVFRGLQQVERNGLSLAHDAVRYRVFEGLWRYARDRNWDVDATQTAYKYTRQIIDLMERSEHCGSRVIQSNDPRTEPFGLGVLIELTARKIEAASSTSSTIPNPTNDALRRELRQAVERMISLLTQQPHPELDAAEAGKPIRAGSSISPDIGRVAQLDSAGTDPEMISTAPLAVSRGWAQAALAQMWLPVANGLNLALQVLPPARSRKLGVLSTELSPETVSAARSSVARVEKLLGQLESSWREVKESRVQNHKAIPEWLALEDLARSGNITTTTSTL